MTNFLVDRDIVCLFYLFLMLVVHWVFLGLAFLGVSIEAYYKLC